MTSPLLVKEKSFKKPNFIQWLIYIILLTKSSESLKLSKNNNQKQLA